MNASQHLACKYICRLQLHYHYSPEYDKIHPCLVRLIVLLQTQLHHAVEIINRFHLLIEPLICVRIRVHVITKHQAAHVVFLDTAAFVQVLKDTLKAVLKDVLCEVSAQAVCRYETKLVNM